MNNKSGFSHLLVILVIVSIFFVLGLSLLPGETLEDVQMNEPRKIISESPMPLSDSNDIETLEVEFNETVAEDIEEDFETLEAEASSL